jgi:choline dehydrogenase-like flavoprotein
MIWVWGHAADFDQWAYAGNKGWDYASLRPVFQSIETCARQTSSGERGSHGPMPVGPVAEPSPLTAGFLKACEEMGHEVLEGVNAPVRDGAGFMDFNIKDGRRFSVAHGYLLPALERQNLTLLTGTRVDAFPSRGAVAQESGLGLGQSNSRLRPIRKRSCAPERSSHPGCSCFRAPAMLKNFAAMGLPR